MENLKQNRLVGYDPEDYEFFKVLKKEGHPQLKGGIKQFTEHLIESAANQLRAKRKKDNNNWTTVLLNDMVQFFGASEDQDVISHLEKFIERASKVGEKKLVSLYWGYKRINAENPGNVYEYTNRLWNIRNWHTDALRKAK